MANQRVFYMSYSYMKLGQQHRGATDVRTTRKMDTDNIIESQRLLAEQAGVPVDDLVITFFAELET